MKLHCVSNQIRWGGPINRDRLQLKKIDIFVDNRIYTMYPRSFYLVGYIDTRLHIDTRL